MSVVKKTLLAVSLAFLVCGVIYAQRAGQTKPARADEEPKAGPPRSAEEAWLGSLPEDDLDYQSFYKYVPREKFEAARRESAPGKKGPKVPFEFLEIDYPMGDQKPRSYRFDMGPADGPVKEGYTRVTKGDVFSWEKGWGWSLEPAAGDSIYTDRSSLPIQKGVDYGVVQNQYARRAFAKRDREARLPLVRMMVSDDTYDFYDKYLDDMTRDSVLNPEELAFKVALPNGRYYVSMVVGDMQIPRYAMDVYANGYPVASNLFTGLIQFRGYSEPASPWVVRVTFPVNVVRNNLRIALRANENMFKERTEAAAETPYYNFSQLPFVMVRGTKYNPFFGKRFATHGPATQMAIAGIRITPYEDPPLELVRQKLFPGRLLANDTALEGVEKFNAGDYEGAEKSFARINDSEYMLKASGYLALAGLLNTEFPEEERLVDAALEILEKGRKANPDDIVAEDLLQAVRFFRGGVYNIVHAAERKLGNVRAEAGCLFSWMTPNDILYSKALAHYGYSFASMDPHRWTSSWQIAEEAYLKLQEREPGNRYSRYYLYWDTEGWELKDYAGDAEGAPKWAVLMQEAYGRMIDQIEWWGQNRQRPDGGLGGGWGDDVEIGLVWEVLLMLNPDVSGVARETVRAIAEGVWWGGEVDRDIGYFDGLADVEHTAEWTGDSQAVMTGIEYGNPTYFERNLKTGKLMRDLWMGRTPRGHFHFKSMLLGNKKIGEARPDGRDAMFDHPLNGRATFSAYWAWWYSPVDTLESMFADWAEAWWEDSRRAENGKPEWAIPGPIGFRTDTLGGDGETKWRRGAPQANAYTNPRYADYIMDLFARMYWKTGDDRWLKPKAVTMTSKEVFEDKFNTMEEHVADLVVEDKYERMESIGLEKILQIQRMTWPSVTSEVANTDRIAMPGLNEILGLLTGGNIAGGPDFLPATLEKTSRNVTFMALESSREAAKVIFYNFNHDPEPVHMRLWKLQVGAEHEVTFGIDANDDDTIDEVIDKFTYKHVHRGDSIGFTIPARTAVIVEVKQTKPGSGMPPRVVDLAAAPEDIRYENGELAVSVHNIGNEASGAFTFNVWEGDAGTGKLLQAFDIEGLEAPNDLEPRIVTRTVAWALPRGATLECPAKITVEIDPADDHYEITEVNNVISRSFPFEAKAYMVPRVWPSLAAEEGLEKYKPFPEDYPKDKIR